MKNFKLLLATAVVFAVGSAFTSVKNDSAADQYHLEGSTWVINSEDAVCQQSNNTVCDYLKTGSATTQQYPNQFQNPDNFTINRMGLYSE